MDSKVIIPFRWLSKDGKLLLVARILRTFAYGFLSVILAIYLKLIGFDDILIDCHLGKQRYLYPDS